MPGACFITKRHFVQRANLQPSTFQSPPSLFHFYANPSSGVGLDLDTGWRLHNALLTLGLIWINPPSLGAGPASTGWWSALRSTSWTDKGTIELQLHHCAACSHCTDCTLQPSQPNVTEKFCWIQCNHPPSDSIIYVSPLDVSAWRQMTCDVRLMLQYSIPGCGQEGDTINTKQRGSMHGKMKFTASLNYLFSKHSTLTPAL